MKCIEKKKWKNVCLNNSNLLIIPVITKNGKTTENKN